jgi:hypothetical protein
MGYKLKLLFMMLYKVCHFLKRITINQEAFYVRGIKDGLMKNILS